MTQKTWHRWMVLGVIGLFAILPVSALAADSGFDYAIKVASYTIETPAQPETGGSTDEAQSVE